MPSTDNKLGGLNNEQWQDLCNCVSQLEKILQSGADGVDLRRYLPPPEAPHRRAVLHELIKAELAARYRRRQGCLLDEFLRQYPELGRADDLPAGLLYEEYLVRHAVRGTSHLGRVPRPFPCSVRATCAASPAARAAGVAARRPPEFRVRHGRPPRDPFNLSHVTRRATGIPTGSRR